MNDGNTGMNLSGLLLKLFVFLLSMPALLACGMFAGDPSPTSTPAPVMVSANVLTPVATGEAPGADDRPDEELSVPTPGPTLTPEPTYTPEPTPTPEPSPTPELSSTPTPQPTFTPQPTYTLVPSATPDPTPTVSPTPVPTSTVPPTPVPTSTVPPTSEATVTHLGEVPSSNGTLCLAVYEGDKNIVEILVESVDDLNAVCPQYLGRTPLYMATYYGKEEMVQILLDAGASP